MNKKIKEIWAKLKAWIDDTEPKIELIERRSTESQEILNQILKSFKEQIINKYSIKSIKKSLPHNYTIYLASNIFDKLVDETKKAFVDTLKIAILDIADKAKTTAKTVTVKLLKDTDLSSNEIVITCPNTEVFYTPPSSFSETGTVTIGNVDFKPRYNLEVWHKEVMCAKFPIKQERVVIGRYLTKKEKAKKQSDNIEVANVEIKTKDKTVSSLHASIMFNSESDIKVEAMHNNITKVGKVVISKDNSNLPSETKLKKNDEIQISDNFKIKLRF
jgi:hypothetical protein